VDKRNSEHYLDPTAYDALMAITREEKAKRYLPLVYIASPFAGETVQNISRAQDHCRFAVSKGCIPLAPHLHFPQFMDDSDNSQRELGLRFALILLGKCDELWVFGGKVSTGMAREIAKAKRRRMPIRYFDDRYEEVTSDD
jgi:hypothetical protein